MPLALPIDNLYPEMQHKVLTTSRSMVSMAGVVRDYCLDLRVRDDLPIEAWKRLRHLAPQPGDVARAHRVSHGWTAGEWRELVGWLERAEQVVTTSVAHVPLSGSRQSLERLGREMGLHRERVAEVADHLDALVLM